MLGILEDPPSQELSLCSVFTRTLNSAIGYSAIEISISRNLYGLRVKTPEPFNPWMIVVTPISGAPAPINGLESRDNNF
jgi:hypothetical protein